MLIFLFGILFMISLQPVFMVSSLILITFFYSFFIYKEVGTYWFSYMLLLVMLSGVLVVFTYMVTLIPNESFEAYNLVMVFMLMFMLLMEYKFDFVKDMGLVTLNLWMTYLGMLSMFLVSFLLIIMLLVVFLSNMNIGALRIK
uniref:NADH dehydrogenase subunit 6 n=1 Tax=Dolomedes angustivirgatus TaxID=492287 RepID=A0A1C8V6A4_9ARAC|nr:NADH dehydrogenase subunit 6 [Dolomedes angustivirgatus]ANW36389.1 NADH dehydrogenase subunit 6 [Dolomedes angustivirgatus]